MIRPGSRGLGRARTQLVATVAIALAAMGLVGCGNPAAGGGSTIGTATPTRGDASPGSSGAATPAEGDASSASSDRIAFTRWNTPGSGQPTLWTGNIDGSDLQPVGHVGSFPDWSPERTHLTFDFLDDSGNQIATIRPDGTGFTQLTDSTYNEAPDYSPDGTTIVFDRSDVKEDDPGFTTTLWVMNADGTNMRPLLAPEDTGFDYEAEYSPDGSAIVFVRYDAAADTAAAYLVDSDGRNLRQLTPFDSYVEHPRWSPDGATIIYNIEYQADLDDPRNGIWLIPAAGSDAEILLRTDKNLHGFKPDYSPDGIRVLFGCLARTGGGTDELCVMNADGTGVERLTSTPTYENHPVWD